MVHFLRMGEKLIIVHICGGYPQLYIGDHLTLGLFWSTFLPTYVRASSVHNVIENCHYLSHLPSPMSLRNGPLVQKAIVGFQFLGMLEMFFVGISPIYKHTFTKPDTIPIPMLEMDIMTCPRITNWNTWISVWTLPWMIWPDITISTWNGDC